MLLLSILLAVELPVLLYLVRRKGFAPFPHLNLIYFVGAQIVIALVNYKVVEYQFLEIFTTGSYKKFYNESLLMFAALFFAFAFLFPAPRSSAPRQSLAAIRALRGNGVILGLALAALIVLHIVLFALFDWGRVWANTTYLLQGNPSILKYEAGGELIRSYKLIGLATVVLATFLWARRFTALFIFSLPFAVFDVLYQLSAHSRAVVLYIGMVGFTHFVLTRRTRILWISSIASVLSLVVSLGGRYYGEHGLSSLEHTFAIMEVYFAQTPGDALVNFFEGAFATTELFNRTFRPNSMYELLAFSPLISAIDGFESVRLRYEYRLAELSPAPAMFELWSFAWPYKILYATVVFMAGRATLKLYGTRAGFIALALNIMMAFAVYLSFTYPVRHVFRLFLAILIGGTLTRAALSFNNKNGRPHRNGEANEGRRRHPYKEMAQTL